MYNVLVLLALTGTALGHLSLLKPLALGSDDMEINFPIGCCGAGGAGPNKEAVASRVPEGPRGCRGHQDKLDSATFDTTWNAGDEVTFTLQSNHPNGLSSTHYGGSCQVGFSFDKLATTKVATSFPGSCPKRPDPSDQTFSFTVPSDIPSGNALFIWTFNNREGEFFESCAPVKINGNGAASNTTTEEPTAPSTTKTSTTTKAPATTTQPEQSIQTSPNEEPAAEEPVEEELTEEEEECTGRRCGWEHRKTRSKRAVSWAERPAMLFNDFPGADCFSQAFQDEQHSTELEYPNPGPDVVKGDGEYPLALPSGAACGA
ncbi:lytic polysaccharide monooxygenase [Lentithecium fluviatile CBS 122367]|uniref:Lytic polysaccharide monooxygenase n=1 Tax=Lentithecium fluviatile CBS 122367 TaxID=1168545 RepID=A0A6G1J0N6_9PLEO|nr:lytic polysaccharide monooxygenase [Lentithecium fluviatile CBS 122367]